MIHYASCLNCGELWSAPNDGQDLYCDDCFEFLTEPEPISFEARAANRATAEQLAIIDKQLKKMLDAVAREKAEAAKRRVPKWTKSADSSV